MPWTRTSGCAAPGTSLAPTTATRSRGCPAAGGRLPRAASPAPSSGSRRPIGSSSVRALCQLACAPRRQWAPLTLDAVCLAVARPAPEVHTGWERRRSWRPLYHLPAAARSVHTAGAVGGTTVQLGVRLGQAVHVVPLAAHDGALEVTAPAQAFAGPTDIADVALSPYLDVDVALTTADGGLAVGDVETG